MYEWALNAVNSLPFVMVDENTGDELPGLTPTVLFLGPGATAFAAAGGSVVEASDGGVGWYVYSGSVAEAAVAGVAGVQITAPGAKQQNLVVQIGSPGTWTHPQRTLTGGKVVVVSPIDTEGNPIRMQVVQGDDYLAVDGRAFLVSSSDWPDLTGADVAWTAQHKTDPTILVTQAVNLLVVGVGEQTVQWELARTKTAGLVPGKFSYFWDVQATLANGSVVSLVSPHSRMTVVKDVTDNS